MSIVKNRKSTGFSLLELVIVILLLGILSVVAIARFSGPDPLAAQAFFNDTLNAVRFAQKLAVSSGCDTRVTITATGYQLEQKASCTAADFSAAIAVQNPANRANNYQNYNLPSGYSLTPASLIFNARGVASADATVSLLQGASVIASFDVVAETGLVYEP